MEEWKDIKGYEGLYQISSLGRVMSLGRVTTGNKGSVMTLKPKMMKISYNAKYNQKSGTVALCPIEGVKYAKKYSVCKLVYSHFKEELDEDDRIIHKNMNYKDDSIDNLQKCSADEFWRWLIDTKQVSHDYASKAVLQVKDGMIIKKFNSIVEAYKQLGKLPHNNPISLCCNGKIKSAYGYQWKYAE